jgi:CRP-like cAMP-binding protein
VHSFADNTFDKLPALPGSQECSAGLESRNHVRTRENSGGRLPRSKRVERKLAPLIDLYLTKLLENITDGKRILSFRKGEKIFAQGSPADAVYFIQSGRVKMTVVSVAGKEAVVGILSPHSCLGEGAMVAQSVRVSSASAMEPVVAFRLEKQAMGRALLEQSELSEKFIAALLVRNIDLEEDLCDQLFNHSEKRLARVLLKLARLPELGDKNTTTVPMLSHETLAEMVGTTRSRITHFMNKFRKLGLIDYNGELTVRTAMLTDLVLHD